MLNLVAIGAGLFALFYPKQTQASFSTIGSAVKKTTGQVFGPFLPSNVWTADKVKKTAASHVTRFGLNCSPVMIAAMVKIESSFNPKAYRYESHLADASYGLMQTMLKTAQWMHDIGYKGYPYPKGTDLYAGECSLYFGMAYVDYLTKYKRKPRNEQWVVESYNGGPGNSNAQTRNHFAKYLKAKTEVA